MTEGTALRSGQTLTHVLGFRAKRRWVPSESYRTKLMPSHYIPIIILAALAAAFPAVTLVLFRFIRPTPVAVGAKLKPYECGVEPEGDTRGRYSVRFYIVAILFVIFDVETTFLFPWAVLFSTREQGFRLPEIYTLASMFVFLGSLFIGYVWLYRKGALEWV